MQEENSTHTAAPETEREPERVGREAADRARPDLRAPRGNQEPEHDDVDRGREKLERVLGW